MKKICKKELIFFLITILIGILMYGNFLTIHYSTDMYRIIENGYINDAITHSLIDGRIPIFIFFVLGQIINIKPEIYQIILTLAAIIINSISVIKLKNILLKYKSKKSLGNEITAYAIAFSIVFNFIMVECMYYIEVVVMSLSILCIIHAANIFINKEKYYYAKTIAMCTLSVMCYQAIIPFFIALVTTLSIIKSKNKEVIKNIVNSIIITVISVFTNILIVKITTLIVGIEQTRVSFALTGIFSNIKYILENIGWIFINQCNIYVNGLFILIIIGIIISVLLSKKENRKKNIINIILIIFVTIFVNFAMHVPTLSAYYTGRTKYAVGAIIGLEFMYIFLDTSIFDKNSWIEEFVTFLLITYISSNIICAITFTNYHKKVNDLEKESALQIEKYMEEYEENNNTKIKNVGLIIIYDQQEKAYYNEIENKSVVTQDALRCNWSAVGTINFYTNRELIEKKLNTEEILKYSENFEQEKNYTCIGDMLVLKVYMY